MKAHAITNLKLCFPNYALPKVPRVLVTMELVRTLEKSISLKHGSG